MISITICHILEWNHQILSWGCPPTQFILWSSWSNIGLGWKASIFYNFDGFSINLKLCMPVSPQWDCVLPVFSFSLTLIFTLTLTITYYSVCAVHDIPWEMKTTPLTKEALPNYLQVGFHGTLFLISSIYIKVIKTVSKNLKDKARRCLWNVREPSPLLSLTFLCLKTGVSNWC